MFSTGTKFLMSLELENDGDDEYDKKDDRKCDEYRCELRSVVSFLGRG